MIFSTPRPAKYDMKVLRRCCKRYCIYPCFWCNTVKFWKYFELGSLLNYANAENIIYSGILKLRVYAFKNRYARLFTVMFTVLAMGCRRSFAATDSYANFIRVCA